MVVLAAFMEFLALHHGLAAFVQGFEKRVTLECRCSATLASFIRQPALRKSVGEVIE
jgi:hypothetical protein